MRNFDTELNLILGHVIFLELIEESMSNGLVADLGCYWNVCFFRVLWI